MIRAAAHHLVGRFGRKSHVDRRGTLFAGVVGPKSLVFDIGANIGQNTAEFRAIGAQVVAFEPNPLLAVELGKRFEHDDGVTVVASGLGASCGTAQFFICSSAPTLSTFSRDWQQGRFRKYSWDDPVDVPLSTLAVEMARFGRPRFAKVDVEGFELDVVRGIEQLPEVMALEYTAEFRDVLVAIIDHLSSIDTCRFAFSPGESGIFSHDGLLDRSEAREMAERLEGDDWGDLWVEASDCRAMRDLMERSA